MSKSETGNTCDHERTIQFDRQWSMPNRNTFDIAPIEDVVTDEISKSNGQWIDPFSGGTTYADVTNDLNPDIESDYSLDAVRFLKLFDEGEIDGGVIFDPPYSPRQIKECYDSIGLQTTKETTQSKFWSDVKDQIARVCDIGSTVVTCSWNSGGIGKTRGFDIRRILLVPHGGWHNDTIVVAGEYIDN